VTKIMQYLKTHGERLDFEIAAAMDMPLSSVREQVTALQATGAVITFNLIRFRDGVRQEAWVCRVSGYIPRPAPGPKEKSQRTEAWS